MTTPPVSILRSPTSWQQLLFNVGIAASWRAQNHLRCLLFKLCDSDQRALPPSGPMVGARCTLEQVYLEGL